MVWEVRNARSDIYITCKGDVVVIGEKREISKQKEQFIPRTLRKHGTLKN